MLKPIIGFNYFGDNKVEEEDLGFKVMSWNVHLFDLGEWTKDETSKAKIIQLISKENPDVLCLEEFYWDEKLPAEPYTAIIQQLGFPYVKLSRDTRTLKSRFTINAGKKDVLNMGAAIFSKYPLENTEEYVLRDKYKMLSTDVIIDSNTILNINTIHLTSVGFGEQEMDLIGEIKTEGLDKTRAKKSKGILRKLMNASSHRADLANKIDSVKRYIDYPMIICGDFNDIPSSYVYRKVKGDLGDAFEAKGHGLGRTYRHIFPTLRIDHILYDKSALEVIGYSRENVGLSDHMPIIANFLLKSQQESKKAK